MQNYSKKSLILKSGFTLVELAIVIVIIGLIVGGVIGAQSLIKSAEINSHISQMRQLETSFNAFKLEFDAIPGDFDEYDDYFSDKPCLNADKTLEISCNGNGNKLIDGYESARFWKHLSSAELWKGNFTGRWGPTPLVNEEVPESVFASNIGLWPTNGPGTGFSPTSGFYGHIPSGDYARLSYFSSTTASYYPSYSNTFLAKTVKNIDKKVDDGKPLKGNILTWKHNFCVEDITDFNSDYRLDSNSKSCWFWNRFN